MAVNSVRKEVLSSPVYKAGDRDERSWGYYEVTGVGGEGHDGFCEKTIHIHPRSALSLQRHSLRKEHWEVVEGALTIIIDGEVLNICAGDWVEVPRAAAHSMINLSMRPAIVQEHQSGICLEGDNDRLFDYNGRSAAAPNSKDKLAHDSIKIYKSIVKLL